jgi:uncharacterized protein (TIGR03083 family)
MEGDPPFFRQEVYHGSSASRPDRTERIRARITISSIKGRNASGGRSPGPVATGARSRLHAQGDTEAAVTIEAMTLSPLPPTDTRQLFRPVSSEFVTLLDQLQPDQWRRPTVAGAWTVRDVVAHLVDGTLRRLSFHRDRLPPPLPAHPIKDDRDFVAFINRLNDDWVTLSKRFSTTVLTRLFAMASSELADFFESLALDAPALFGVSWAGERESEAWLDVGREFTELWHHQKQVRLAVAAPASEEPRFLHAVIEIALRALPHAYRDLRAPEESTVTLEIGGAAGGTWTLRSDPGQWTLWAGAATNPTARVRLSDDTAWRLLFHALPADSASAAIQIDGRQELAQPLLGARSVIV